MTLWLIEDTYRQRRAHTHQHCSKWSRQNISPYMTSTRIKAKAIPPLRATTSLFICIHLCQICSSRIDKWLADPDFERVHVVMLHFLIAISEPIGCCFDDKLASGGNSQYFGASGIDSGYPGQDLAGYVYSQTHMSNVSPHKTKIAIHFVVVLDGMLALLYYQLPAYK